MSAKSPRDVPASVRQRLLNLARSEHRPFSELLQYYAMERFLYRLSCSAHVDRFILKGALMLRAWRAPDSRPTMDIDMLGRTSNEEAAIVAQVRDVLAVNVEPDGMEFDPGSIQAERITEDADYRGIRIRFRSSLDAARVNMQLDIGFGDALFPGPEELDLPTILDSPAPRLLCYSRESAIAEKFEAMLKLRELNSRMKDFYDIWLLARQFNFAGISLAEAIRLTFEWRGTSLPTEIEAFTDNFTTAKQVQWTAFRRRFEPEQAPISFGEVVAVVSALLDPVASALASGTPLPVSWTAPGPWV